MAEADKETQNYLQTLTNELTTRSAANPVLELFRAGLLDVAHGPRLHLAGVWQQLDGCSGCNALNDPDQQNRPCHYRETELVSGLSGAGIDPALAKRMFAGQALGLVVFARTRPALPMYTHAVPKAYFLFVRIRHLVVRPERRRLFLLPEKSP